MLKGMWNYAIKATDMQKTVDFYIQVLGGEKRATGEIYGAKYALLRLGETRIIIFDKAPYETDLSSALPPGFLHVVYEVDNVDAVVSNLRSAGAKFFMEPRVLTTEFGVRKIAFFEAPDGLRTEVMQVLEDFGNS